MALRIVAIAWVIFAALWLFRDSEYRYLYALMGAGNAGIIAILAYYLSQRRRWAKIALLIVLGLNIILTVTDQVGWFDLAYLVPAVIVFVMVCSLRHVSWVTASRTAE